MPGRLAGLEGLDDVHAGTAARAWRRQDARLVGAGHDGLGLGWRRRDGQQLAVQAKLEGKSSDEEAERQSRGEDVTQIRDERPDIETFSEDAMFEEGGRPEEPGEGEQP